MSDKVKIISAASLVLLTILSLVLGLDVKGVVCGTAPAVEEVKK